MKDVDNKISWVDASTHLFPRISRIYGSARVGFADDTSAESFDSFIISFCEVTITITYFIHVMNTSKLLHNNAGTILLAKYKFQVSD